MDDEKAAVIADTEVFASTSMRWSELRVRMSGAAKNLTFKPGGSMKGPALCSTFFNLKKFLAL